MHFAGSSNLKNTLENVHAGLILINRFRDTFDKLIVKITKWPKGNYALGEDLYHTLKDIQCKNSNIMVLHDGGFISDQTRAEIYRSSRLALCASGKHTYIYIYIYI